MSMSIEVSREIREVSTLGGHVANPDWSLIDAAGHSHRFEDDKLPTLEWVVTATFWCPECRDEHDEGEWRCRLCGERVEPKWCWTGPETIRVPGLATFTLRLGGEAVEIAPWEATAFWEVPTAEREAKARALFERYKAGR